MQRPDLVKQVVDFAKTNGIRAAYQKVQTRLDTVSGLGYSCSGIVLAVGEGATEFQPGDRVACAGVGYATHSEINFVPRNLAAKIPESVSLEAASLTTIGAIAMQGLRQANVSLGENVVVVGAGLVGVLTVLLARAAGCRVIAIDANPSRAKQAEEFGASLGLSASEPSLSSKIVEAHQVRRRCRHRYCQFDFDRAGRIECPAIAGSGTNCGSWCGPSRCLSRVDVPQGTISDTFAFLRTRPLRFEL